MPDQGEHELDLPRLIGADRRVTLGEFVAATMPEAAFADAELLRAICSTLDSPLPPFFEAMPCVC